MHPNAERIRRGYEAFANGDLETIDALLDDAIVWRVPGRGPLAGDHRGKEAVFGLFAEMFRLSRGTLRVEIIDVLANDRRAVAITRSVAELGGRWHEQQGVAVYEIRDGRAVEAVFMFVDPIAVDTAWSEAAADARAGV